MVRTKGSRNPVDYRISWKRGCRMSTRTPRTPTYRRHKPSGQAVVTLNGQDRYLGRWNTTESRNEYDRLIAEWLTPRRQPPTRGTPGDGLSVNELILAYYHFVEGYYRRPDDTPTSEIYNVKLALRPLRKLYGHTQAATFDCLALEAVREQMIRAGR